jgi:signal transduction histidine kinase
MRRYIRNLRDRLLSSPRIIETESYPKGFVASHRLEEHQLLKERLRLALIVGIPIYLGFFLLDLYQTPEHVRKFLAIRLVVVSFAVLTIWLTATDFGDRYLLPISVGMVWIGSFGISLMTASLSGFASDYYIGNLLVLFLVGFFIPWQLGVTALFCCGLMFGYFSMNLIQHGPGLEMLPPVFFMVGTSVFTCVASATGSQLRRRDLGLRLSLEQANTDLTRIDEAKTRFFSNVSHELRTPLTLMLGPVESLLKEEPEEERQSLLRSVLSNSQRLLRQVNLLLDTAKLESGALVLEARQNSLGRLLEDLVSASLPHAEGRGQLLRLEGTERLEPFSFDRGKMEMIAANLLSNALKFTPEQGSITVRADSTDEAVSFEVEDSGPGIPADQMESIFARFHQVDTSLSREEGTGLGLSLARELARLHGGDVQVSSTPGRGSCFRVEIPRKLDTTYAERRRLARRKEDRFAQARTDVLTAKEYEQRSRRDTLLADLRKPRLSEVLAKEYEGPEDAPLVLIVDDNADLVAFLRRQLSAQYRVETAKDGVRGLELARKTRPSLIVLDVMMPRMDGYEVCRQLKKDAGLAAIPVILVTAKAGSEAIVEGLEIGADDYVTKPFSTEELEARIAAHLRAKDTERELHEKESRLAAIGQLTSGVVHDVRNALMLIQGYSDLARSTAMGGGSTEDLVKDLDEIKDATQRLQRMSSEILDYARGGSELNRQTLPARDYLSATLSGLITHLEGQGIGVAFDLDLAVEETVSLDPDRFQRVLENIVFNARDALLEHGGERRVMIQAGRHREALEIRVADTGPGIAPEIAGERGLDFRPSEISSRRMAARFEWNRRLRKAVQRLRLLSPAARLLHSCS